MKTLLVTLSLLAAVPAGAEQASSPPPLLPLPIAAIPRLSTVDVGLQLSGIPPLAPMTMKANPGPRRFVAHQRGTVGGCAIAYDSMLAQTLLADSGGHRLASVSSTSYVTRTRGGSSGAVRLRRRPRWRGGAAQPDLAPERYFREHRTIEVAGFNADLLRDRGLVLDRNNGPATRPVRPGRGRPVLLDHDDQRRARARRHAGPAGPLRAFLR